MTGPWLVVILVTAALAAFIVLSAIDRDHAAGARNAINWPDDEFDAVRKFCGEADDDPTVDLWISEETWRACVDPFEDIAAANPELEARMARIAARIEEEA